jgi:mannosyltransferase OCH1-like enzyme
MKNISIRKDIFIKNHYEIVKNYNYNDDFHIVLYYINKNKAKIIIRRLDDENGWCLNLFINLYDIEKKIYETISLGSSYKNDKIIFIYTNILLYPEKYKKQKIPKRIIQTYKNEHFISKLHYNAVKTFIELNPEYEYIFFDDYDCREFIKINFDKNILKTYDLLVPGAYKADLFRYCYIYINGGCYFDHKYILRIPLRKIIKEYDNEILCKDTLDDLMFNSIIMCVPKLDELKKCIDNIVENVKYNYYGNSSLEPTGPKLFNKYVHNKNILFKHFINGKYYKDCFVKILKNNEIFLNTFYHGYYFNPSFVREEYDHLFKNNYIYYKNYVYCNCCKKNIMIIFPNPYDDIFEFKYINNNQLEIIRIDLNNGWEQDLKVKIINNQTNKFKIINIGKSNNKKKIHNI